MMKKPSVLLILAALVYLGLRGMILFTNFDAVALEGYELHPMGNLAKNTIEGEGFPLINYCDSHSGGELVTGFCAVPFYLILGHNYLALKMVPLLFGLLALIILYFFLRENFSSPAAVIFAFLFAMAPTTLSKHSLLAMGNHYEILLFVSLLLFFYYRFHTRAYQRRWLALAAFTAGFALFHNFSSALVIGLIVLVHFGERGFLKSIRDAFFCLPIFLLGLFPLLLINLGTQGAGGGFLKAKFADGIADFLGRIPGRLGTFFLDHLPKAGCFDPLAGLPGKVADYAWLACFLAVVLLFTPCFLKGIRIIARRLLGRPADPGFRTARDDAEKTDEPAPFPEPGQQSRSFQCLKVLPLGLYLPLLGFAFALGDFRLGGYPSPHEVGGYRYFLTFFLFATLLIALGAARLILSRRYLTLRVGGFCLLGLALCTGLFNIGVMDFDSTRPPLIGRFYEGYYYPQLSRGIFGEAYRKDPALMEAAIKDFRPVFKSRVYAGVGFLKGLFEIRPASTKMSGPGGQATFRLENLNLPRLLQGLPERYRLDAARGVGTYLRDVLKAKRPLNKTGAKDEVLNRLKQNPCPEIPNLLEGLMLEHDFLLESRSTPFLKMNLTIIAAFPKECMPYLWHGQGIFCGRLLHRAISTEENEIERLAHLVPEAYQPEFYHGLGWGVADGSDHPALPPAFERLVPDAMHISACQGFSAALKHLHDLEEYRRVLEDIKRTLPARFLQAIEKGM